MTQTVKYRLINPQLAPRRTRLEIPGWSGDPAPRADGSHEQAWHCIPFSEAARAGIELCYPYEAPLHVTTTESGPVFTDAAGSELAAEHRPPLRSFGAAYYTYQVLIDLKVEPGYALKTEPHPSFYTDRTGTVPIAVPALLRHWWPMINFVVFKSPAAGQTHVFRPGEPFIQITLVEADQRFDLVEMPEDEAAERDLQGARIHQSRTTLSADTTWTSATNTVFDGTYRRILGAARGTKRP